MKLQGNVKLLKLFQTLLTFLRQGWDGYNLASMNKNRKYQLMTQKPSQQGGRSCAGARVAPAEKFGLGRKF